MSNPNRVPPDEKDLLLATLDLPTDQRSSYLKQACGSDLKLKARVEELLRNAEQGDSFMAQPAVDLNPTTVLSSIKVGGQIGRYRLMEQLGEGGMGVVYVAEQIEPVRRKVALKVIKPGMDSKQVIARFEAERQALALMDHINIARVLDAGTTEQGLPYFVMELARGLPITQYCDTANANTHKRLELFIAVCDAVNHAHQKGIIHRDIKPGNVLVTLHDGKPVVKVIDFGVAKALHQQLSQHTVYTALNQVVGTPLYMSPEQLELSGLDIDTRTDVYSLGVMLYELLTGSTPFDRERLLKSGFDEMRRIIREEEPPRPSYRITTLPKAELSTVANKRGLDDRTFTRSVQNELDWITLKALEKDRNRRYESASAFGADIQRFLDDEPVLACPPSVAYRAKKLMRRHRVFLTTTALILIASIVGTTVSIWQAMRANLAKQEAIASNAIAKQAVDEMYTQFAERWLAEEGNASQTQREFLEKAMAFYETTATNVANEPILNVERLKARERVCNIQIKLGQHQEAEQGLTHLIDECRKQLASNPSLEALSIIELESMEHLGSLLWSIGKKDVAGAQFDQAAGKLPLLAANKKLDASQKSDLATASARLCTVLQRANRRETSEAAIQTAIHLWQELLSADPTSWNHRVGLAQALERQGLQRMWFGDRIEEAKTVFLESKDQLLRLLQERPRDRTCREKLASVYLSLGVLASWSGQWEQALAYQHEGIAIAKRLAQDYPTDQHVLSTMNTLLGNTGNTLDKLGSINEAKEAHKQYLESSERLVELFPTVIQYVRSYRDAASLASHTLYVSGDHAGAVSLTNRYRESIELIRNQNGQEYIEDLRSLANAATLDYVILLLEEKRPLDAIKALEKIDWDDFVFQSEELTRATDVHADVRYLNNCAEHYWFLQRPCTLIRECVDLLDQDASLTNSSKRDLTESIRWAAERCTTEADKVREAWRVKLTSVQLSSEDIVALHYRLMTDENRSDALRVVKRIHRETNGQFAMDLPPKLDDLGQEAMPGDLSYMIGELTAGEEYQRDPELALRLAKRALEMRPSSGMAKQDLAWALFRNGEYEESLRIQGPNVPRVDATESAVMAMTLWHLGRKVEAAACLDAPYEEQLTNYLARRRTSSPSERLVWPTASNLLRLDLEAKTLLGTKK